jgi:hypothetical protein
MRPLARRLLLLGTAPVLLLACSLNPQPLPPGEQAEGGSAGPADATTGDGSGLINGPDGGAAADATSDTVAAPGLPDGSGDGETDAAGDGPGEAGTQDAPTDGPAEEGG